MPNNTGYRSCIRTSWKVLVNLSYDMAKFRIVPFSLNPGSWANMHHSLVPPMLTSSGLKNDQFHVLPYPSTSSSHVDRRKCLAGSPSSVLLNADRVGECQRAPPR